MSDTPRTDAKEDHCRCLNDRAWGIQGWKFAEQLERELAAVTKERDEIPNCIGALESQAREYRKVMLEIETKNETLKQQRDTLAEALNDLWHRHSLTGAAYELIEKSLATLQPQPLKTR